MIILQAGSEKAGKWHEEDINILEDYRKAFGTDPPPVAKARRKIPDKRE